MEEKLLAAKQMLQKYGQEHLLNSFNSLSKERQSELLDAILTTNFKQMQELYETTKIKANFENAKLEPISHVTKAELSQEELEKYTSLGEDAIKAGKLAVVTMAGGQGTRLGHNGPKGTYDLGLDSHKSIFEILCDTMREACEKYHVTIPWYLMTSDTNNEDTIQFFKDHNYF